MSTRKGGALDDTVRAVGMIMAAIALGKHGDRRQPHFTARADNSNRDFAAVGDQDFVHEMSGEENTRKYCTD